ncbi:MAG: GNAT family N-acetyltransferase [Egibacteraceae bacterium]
MSRRIRDLPLSALDHLPQTCRACVFWEVGRAPRGPQRDARLGREAKEAWWQATQLEWGVPGKAVYVDDVLAGYATFAPSTHFPRARQLGRPSDDALLLATLWVDPEHRGTGLATMLLQSVLREVHRRGGRALEAYGARSALDLAGPCMVPESFLLSRGFQVLHEHHSSPLLRLDLRQTARWQEVGQALGEALSTLARRERQPAPAPTTPAVGTRG